VSDFQFVLPRVAVGSAINDAVVFSDDLEKAGIFYIVDCQGEHDDTPFLATRKMFTCWCPTEDNGQPKDLNEWWGKGIKWSLENYAKPNVKIYFHCAAGVNRGPSMCFGFLLALGISATAAEILIRSARPQVGLAYKVDAILKVSQLGY
jgi:hypothetical protein